MLGTYFTLILAMFVVMIVGAVIGYSQSMDEVRGAVEKSMDKFKDNVDAEGVSKEEKAITNAWNTLQEDVSYTEIIKIYPKITFEFCSSHAVVLTSMEPVTLEIVGSKKVLIQWETSRCQNHVATDLILMKLLQIVEKIPTIYLMTKNWKVALTNSKTF